MDRYITVMIDYATGTHQLLNIPTLPREQCVQICQALPPTPPGYHKLILKSNPNAES
jgi:hypothetical protein